MKRYFFSLLALTVFSGSVAKAQDATAAILTAGAGAGGYIIGKAAELPAAGTAALAGGLPLLANFGYGFFKNKNDEDKIKYYISGRNYERWIRSNETWYQSTLDPYTGRPQAFSGLNAMDDGMPKNAGNANGNSGGNNSDVVNKVYTVPVKMPAGTYNGVPYTERITDFPKLP
jgi:hypothetical protein